MNASVVGAPTALDAWVCYCHNAPLRHMMGHGYSVRRECDVHLPPGIVHTLRQPEMRDTKWFRTTDGHWLENQGVWGTDDRPDDASRAVEPDALYFWVHMYVAQAAKPSLAPNTIGQHRGEASYIDDAATRIWVRRSLTNPYGLEAPQTYVRDLHYGKGRTVWQYVRSFTYLPMGVELLKAEYEFLLNQITRDFNEIAAAQSGVKKGIVLS